MSLLQNVSDQLAGPKHGPSQQTAPAGITQDILTWLQVCWEPESSQLSSPAHQGTAALERGSCCSLRARTALPGGPRGAECVDGANRDTREVTPPPAQPRVGIICQCHLPALAHLIPSRNHSNALELRGLGAPGDPLFQHESKGPTSCCALSGNTPDRPHHGETNEQKVINKCKKRRQRMARVFGSSGCQDCPA